MGSLKEEISEEGILKVFWILGKISFVIKGFRCIQRGFGYGSFFLLFIYYCLLRKNDLEKNMRKVMYIFFQFSYLWINFIGYVFLIFEF